MIKKYDFIVIGSGISGLNFAIKASKHGRIAVITKKELMESNSNYAQGGIAAVLDKKDNYKKHIEDTLIAGSKINNQKAVEAMVKNAPKQIQELIDLGVGFNKQAGKLSLTKEGGHTAKRIAHARDATGKEIERALLYNIRHNKNIETFESHLAIDLIVSNKICTGVSVLDNEKNKIINFFGKAIILATGGAAQVYERNCNPKIATGDGIAMAYRAGTNVQDMEFIQFHPTALNIKGKPAFLVSETVRGEGAFLLNANKKRFMQKYHKQKELASRDIVSKAIFEQLKKGPVYLDARKKGAKFLKTRFPYIYDQLWWFGIKMDKDLIPIAPAAHYICGGIKTDLYGKTSIKGLYAFGEVAHTGVHGANRLASNSLLECMVFSDKAYRSAIKYIKSINRIKILKTKRAKISQKNLQKIYNYKSRIKKIMWNNVGVVRNQTKMKETLNTLRVIYNQVDKLYAFGINKNIVEVRNLCQVAILITESALNRKKSIGCHYIEK